MPNTLIDNKPAVQAISTQSRKVRIIHRDSFGTSDRGEEWGWSAQATWWHRMRGVKGFHKRILFGFCARADYPQPPTVEDIAAARNDQTEHTWGVSS